MGVEPTRATSAAPLTGFEDRGAHRDSTTPQEYIILFLLISQGADQEEETPFLDKDPEICYTVEHAAESTSGTFSSSQDHVSQLQRTQSSQREKSPFAEFSMPSVALK
jgi:hypothetical protein